MESHVLTMQPQADPHLPSKTISQGHHCQLGVVLLAQIHSQRTGYKGTDLYFFIMTLMRFHVVPRHKKVPTL